MDQLPDLKGKYRLNYQLSHLTWFKVGGPADIFYQPHDLTDLVYFLKNKPFDLPVTIIGAGSNMIIRDGGIEGAVIRLGSKFADIELAEDKYLAVGAGCLNYNLAKYAQQAGIQGFEFLIGIPGTIGGGVMMNAGCYGAEFKDIIEYVEAVNLEGEIRRFSNDDLGFSYRKNALQQLTAKRGSEKKLEQSSEQKSGEYKEDKPGQSSDDKPTQWIFTKAFFKISQGDRKEIAAKIEKITKDRAKTQPTTEKTGGSTFANPPNHRAWQLIDQAGLRGFKLGGASMSEKHCNFMINDGSAKADDLEQLGELVKTKVKEKCSIDLKWEIKLIGRNIKEK